VPRRKSHTLTDVELEFMRVVWAGGEVYVEYMRNALKKRARNLQDGTIRKVLGILVRKGYLIRRREGRRMLYKARFKPDQTRKGLVKNLVDRAFGGSATMMVASLLDSRAVRKKDIAEIKKLIAAREKGG